MIRAYDKDNMAFLTYDWGYVAKRDEIEFHSDTLIAEINTAIDDCEALLVLVDTSSGTNLLLPFDSIGEAADRLETAVKVGYLVFTQNENPIEVFNEAFDIVET